MASVKLSVEAIPHARGGSVLLYERTAPRFPMAPSDVRIEEVAVPLVEVGEAIVPGLSYRLRLGAYCPTRDPHEIRLVVSEGAMELREADALRMPSLLSSLYYERKRAAIAEEGVRFFRSERDRLRPFEAESKKAESARYAESWTERWGWE